MEFSSINIQGNIISSEILNKIRNEDIKYQQGSDFCLDKKTSVRDEIGIAWAAARAHFAAFKLRVERLKEGDSGASETRNSWMLPLLRELGYDVEKAVAFIHPDTQKSYAISHKAANLGDFPIHIMGVHDDLDRRRESGGPRLSPHALTQEFLNNTDHTYALVTNGQYLRLLRDATRLVRLSYLEFDLQKMMEEELYADFAILFRLLHATRMPKKADALEESYIEYYHQESLASGSRIREKLSEAVENSIRTLANGFLRHPSNSDLRKQALSSLPSSDFYLHQLRLIYRFLFLIVTEERNLVYPDTKDEVIQKQRKIYYDFYSIERLRRLAAKLNYVDGRKSDLWEGLKATFLLFEKGYYGEKLGIKPLGSGLFAGNALGSLQNIKLDNESLLKVIRYLTLFENDQKQLVRVNYSDLDVEEFGSVYEGLLEYDAVIEDINGSPVFRFKKGSERTSSGSHYTPEELVKPLIKNSLEYLIEQKLTEKDSENALLGLKVVDVACGSGHILLSAARRIAFEVACIRETKAGSGRERVEQPSPKFLRAALREVIKSCIYGVDKNPLAVELCKVALWLEAHNPGEPLNFLDHHIKCGDAIVGLSTKEELSNGIADEAFKALSEKEKEINFEIEDKKGNKRPSTLSASFLKRNQQERATRGQAALNFEGNSILNLDDVLKAFKHFEALPENTPEEIENKAKAYNTLIHSGALQRLKTIADILVGQFFIPKIIENKDKLVTDAQFFRYLKGEKPIPQTVLGETIAQSRRHFFHWFLEFPEVFQKGGFDCILGNPPYLGGSKLSTHFGLDFLNYIHHSFSPAGGRCDLAAYFLRRDYQLLNSNGYTAIITTNSINQGETRDGGLDYLESKKCKINFAFRSIKWPGVAAVEVTLLGFTKNSDHKALIIDGKPVKTINSFLSDNEFLSKPYPLVENKNLAFQGTNIYGKGFIISKEETQNLIRLNPKNNEIIDKYLTGDEINNSPTHEPERCVINFWHRTEEEAMRFEECYKIVKDRVKPDRDKVNRDKYRKVWWQFGEKCENLYKNTAKLDSVIGLSRVTKYIQPCLLKKEGIFSDATVIFSNNSYSFLAIINSTFHYEWCNFASSALASTIRYNPSDCIANFPLPLEFSLNSKLETIGKQYEDFRQNILVQFKLGLTKLYNLFHNPSLTSQDLQNSLKISHTESEELLKALAQLRKLHIDLDKSFINAYGWSIELNHDFREVEYLSENDRIRYSIHPDARKEVLKRLIELNNLRYEEEINAGLHSLDVVEQFYAQKGMPVPSEILVLLGKGKKQKKKKDGTVEKENIYRQTGLFELPNLFNTEDMKEFSLNEGIYSVKDTVEITGLSKDKIKRWFSELSKEQYEGLDNQGRSDVDSMRISFHGLIELVVIGTLRDNGFTLKKILKSRNDLKQRTNTVYPFATNNVRDNLKVAGNNIVFEFSSGVITLDGTGQYNIDFIKTFFKDIYFDVDGVAQRIIPAKGKGKIVIDPKEGGGKPAIIGKEIWVDLINNIYTGAESIQMIKEQYNLEEDEILAAIEFSK